jgi:energy-coupling factor transporter ATP-binding protein EcfA2
LIVRSLELDNFKRFRSLRLELGEGLNVIKGPNESGKSTLIQALMALLYWKPNSRAADVLECSGWGGGEGFSLSALLESGDRGWSLSKDFSRHTALLEGNEGKVRDLDSIESWVAEETGLDSEGLYRSTACIGHEDIGELNRGKGELENGLQASVTGGRGGGGGGGRGRRRRGGGGVRKRTRRQTRRGG